MTRSDEYRNHAAYAMERATPRISRHELRTAERLLDEGSPQVSVMIARAGHGYVDTVTIRMLSL